MSGVRVPRWWWAYDAALAVIGLIGLPYYYTVRRPGAPGLAQRFGRYPAALRAALAQGAPPIWVHAVSVGEVVAALPLIAALKARAPGRRWVVSTTTPTGQRLARERLPEDLVLYVPWDLTGPVRRAIAAIRPRLFLGLETELWPNLFWRLSEAGVPIAVVNGRISTRSFRRYQRIRRWIAPALAQVRLWSMQTVGDAERILALGVDPSRVHVVGNLKADAALPSMGAAQLQAWRGRLGLRDGTPLWIAGSTHPGEEAIVLQAFRQVRVDGHPVRLLLAPRHPERVGEVERVIRQAGLTPRRWSAAQGEAWEPEAVMILDTVGELAHLYATADLVFVGGSLVPRGGHNLLEPAQWAKPMLSGPAVQNFQSIADLLEAGGGLVLVQDAETLAAQVRQWVAHPELRRQIGERARAVVAAQAGSTAKTVDLLSRVVGSALVTHAS